MSDEKQVQVVIIDPENIIPQLGGTFKGINFVRFDDKIDVNGNSVYTLRRDKNRGRCKIIINDEVVGEVPINIPKFDRGLKSKIVKIENSRESTSPKIMLPKLHRCLDGSMVTSLKQECDFLNSMIGWRLQSIRFKEEQTGQAVLNILLNSAERGIHISNELRDQWKNVIDRCVEQNKPVVLTMSLAIGTRIPNPLKFFDDVNLPTFGWMYFFFFIKLLSEKVKLVYPPGIRLVIFDEAWLFGRFLDISQTEIEVNLRAVNKIISTMEVPVEIILMQQEHFDIDEINKINPYVNNSQVYGFLCSLPEMNNPVIMNSLYRRRQRNYRNIQLAAGSLWDEAQYRSQRVAQYLVWRKRSNLFGKLIGTDYIDTTITDKDERLVIDVTCSLMNHGMPVVRCSDNGMLKVDIVPEYRIPGEYERLIPVWIRKTEFESDLEGSFKFYYLEI